MLKNVRKLLKRINKDNAGSAIVLVIVALAMVGILAMTIMWMSMTNYYMKATDKGNKQGFYSSETVLEQIKAGLEEDASWAASRAYAFILTKNYSATSTADRDYEFKKEYQNYFIKRVAEPTDSSKYSLDHLLGFVDSGAGVQLTYPSAGNAVKYLSSSTGTCKLIHSYSSNLMKLEGIHLEYTDTDINGNEYVSVIDTDIIVMVPDVSFTQTSVLPDVFEYALVADKKLKNTNIGTGDIVKGNIYAGDDGVELLNSLSVSDAGMFISKGDVRIGTDNLSSAGATLSITGGSGTGNSEFWANDITLGKGTQLTTNKVDTYVADDLTLSGRKSKVTMSGAGNYYGYGNSNSKASESSAVVINGIGSEVDMDDLGKVLLLGRTFVSIPQQTLVAPGVVSLNSIDFAMGESLAVKGEQIAFLVPDECLSYVEISASSNAVPMPNPFVKSTYPTDADGDHVDDHEIKVNLSTLSSYVNVTNGYKIVQPYGSDLGYVYMQMSGDKANEYYEKYYKNNKERLNNYFMVYAGSGKIELPAGSNISADGNFLSALKSDSSVVSDNVIYNTDSQLYRANLQTGPDAGQAVAIHDDYTTKKDNLCAKLIKQGVTPTEFANKLFDNLVLRNDIISLINLNSSDPLYGGANKYSFIAHNDTDGHDYKAVFAKYDSGTPFDYNDTDIRVLVVVGDVEINADFTGLLIASGTVTINGGHTITSIVNVGDSNQMQALKDSLQKKQSLMYLNTVSAGSLPHAEERSALQYFRDGSGYDLDGLQKNGSSTVSKNNVEFTELVKFNNWIKK